MSRRADPARPSDMPGWRDGSGLVAVAVVVVATEGASALSERRGLRRREVLERRRGKPLPGEVEGERDGEVEGEDEGELVGERPAEEVDFGEETDWAKGAEREEGVGIGTGLGMRLGEVLTKDGVGDGAVTIVDGATGGGGRSARPGEASEPPF